MSSNSNNINSSSNNISSSNNSSSSSAIEAKLQQLQKAAVAIATGPGSIIAEDGKIAKALNLPAFAKSVKNSYVVSPSRKHPVSGLYAVTELATGASHKPPSGAGLNQRSHKISSTSGSHQSTTTATGGGGGGGGGYFGHPHMTNAHANNLMNNNMSHSNGTPAKGMLPLPTANHNQMSLNKTSFSGAP